MPKFQAADYGGEIERLVTLRGVPFYPSVSFNWSAPQLWNPSTDAPIPDKQRDSSFLYIITRKAGRTPKPQIVYVGLTTNPKARFNLHHMAEKLFSRGVSVALSIGEPDFGRRHSTDVDPKIALEELEHIFIWTVWKDLRNEKKWWTVPGQGVQGGRAWHIKNLGHHFDYQMPSEIVFPWPLIKMRDRRKAD